MSSTYFDLITDTAPLPSGRSPGEVRIRPFVLGDQKELVSSGKSGEDFQVYNKLLSRLITSPKDLDLTDLLMSDVVALMFAVRVKSFGPMLKMPLECEECNQNSVVDVDLTQVLCKNHEEIPGFAADGLEVELSGKTYVVHLPRLKDERTASTLIKDLKAKGQTQDPDVDRMYIRRAVLIDSIDGETPTQMSKYEHLLEMSIQDYEDLRDFIKDHDTGLMLEDFRTVCPKCSAPNDLPLYITPDFFRPSARR